MSYPPRSVLVMTTEPRLGVGLAVAVVGPRPETVVDRPSRLSEVLDPSWLDDVACAGEMVSVNRLRAALDAYEVGVVARLADLRPDFWQETDTPGGPVEGWSPVRSFVGVSEFFVDEVAAVLGISRTRAHTVANTALVLVGQLPATWHALADGHIDLARARALVHVLGWQQPEVSADVVAAVEAEALGWAIAGEGPYRLQDRTAALLLERDAEAADRARKRAEREADVQVHGRRDGLADLTVTLQPDIAAACRDTADRYARMWKADGDDRPIGLLRTLVLADLVLRPWDTSRPSVTAHITIHAPLPALVPPQPGADPGPPTGTSAPSDGPAGEDGAGPSQLGTVGGLPVTSAHLRELMARWSDAGLDGLTAPDDGSLDVAVTDPHTGRLRAVVTGPELRRVAARACPQHPGADTPSCGCPLLDAPPATTAYRPTAAQRQFIAARDRGCRHPGCSRPALWTDADHVLAHQHGGPTDCANLCTLCRRHHRLKTHAPGWRFAMTADGVLSVTTPSGVTRTTRPPGMGHGLDHLVRLLDPAAEPPPQIEHGEATNRGDAAPSPPHDDPPPF